MSFENIKVLDIIIQKNIILSRVYDCVTNNNGFWIGWLDLLTASLTITLNHNQSSAEPFFLDCRGLAPFSFLFYHSDWLLTWNSALYSLEADPTENTVSQKFVGVFTAPLPRNGRPLLSSIVVRITQQRAVYQESVSAGTCSSSRWLAMNLYVAKYKGRHYLQKHSAFSNTST
jgi:hypothetical protein